MGRVNLRNDRPRVKNNQPRQDNQPQNKRNPNPQQAQGQLPSRYATKAQRTNQPANRAHCHPDRFQF